MLKIYTDDPLVHYTKSAIPPERTKQEIDALLRAYDADLITWRYKPEFNDIFVGFTIEEVLDGIHIRIPVKVQCPIVWNRGVARAHTPERRVEQPNILVSMRAMLYYIKSHLNCAYLTQSGRVRAFLPDIVTDGQGTTLFEQMKGNLDKYNALEFKQEVQSKVEIIAPINVSKGRDEFVETETQ
jgi:hypothetical protein